jgi:hypothetical protein
MVLNPEHFWQYYFYAGLFATILFIVKLIIFSVAGGDSEVFGDFNTETDTDVSFNFFSIQSVLAFFMGFGWMGYAGLRQLQIESQMQNLMIALGVGFIFMFVSSTLMFLAKKLEKNVVKDKSRALNKVGKAYTSFAPNGTGQIEVDINGQLTVVQATNTSDVPINSFDSVVVTAVKDDMLYITKV